MFWGTAASPASTVCDRLSACTLTRYVKRSAPSGPERSSSGRSKKRDWASSVSRRFACVGGRESESTKTSIFRPAMPPVRSKYTRTRIGSLYAGQPAGATPLTAARAPLARVFPPFAEKA